MLTRMTNIVADPEVRKLGVGHATELAALTQVAKSDTGRKMLGFYSACERTLFIIRRYPTHADTDADDRAINETRSHHQRQPQPPRLPRMDRLQD